MIEFFDAHPGLKWASVAFGVVGVALIIAGFASGALESNAATVSAIVIGGSAVFAALFIGLRQESTD